jgi:hypothetical protein
MRCKTVLLAVAFYAVVAFCSVSAQENGTFGNQSSTQSGNQSGNQPGQQAFSGSSNGSNSQADVQAAAAAASADQGSVASAASWDPGNCGGEFLLTCCQRFEDTRFFESFIRNQCFCNSLGGRAVPWEQCFVTCRCDNAYSPVCCNRGGISWWVTNSCQCGCFKGFLADRSDCRV